ncbi:MAG TPA: hypothetical protein PK869_05830 [Candidatus Hydrogenedentes bacterium]|nr:hypothetical protein [Candidatus Hydrogenedentota bacterium]
MSETITKKPSWPRLLLRWSIQFVVVVVVLGTVVIAFMLRGALYNRFYLFPRQAEAWAMIDAARQEVTLDDGWTEYRGVCHSHSELSHDCEVRHPDILRAAKLADINFICMTDHARDGVADYSWGWRDIHDGVLFIRGFELGHGYMPWGLPDDTILSRDTDPATLAEQIAAKGGVLFFAHSEEERDWELPELNGMEIYNIHTDVKDEGYDNGIVGVLSNLGGDFILSLGKYPEQTMRLLFDRQTAILKHWDELNMTRKIVGITASDAHQNFGFRGAYTEDGHLRFRDNSPDEGSVIELNWATRGLLDLFFGPLEPGRQLFRVEFDRYDRSLHFSNTHVLARDLTEPEVIGALRAGRVFIAFDMLADARGFTFLAEGAAGKAVMGEEIAIGDGLTLRAESPVPCRFTLVHNGVAGAVQEGRHFESKVTEPGIYRLEAELYIVNEWVPWVYTNHIRAMPRPAA